MNEHEIAARNAKATKLIETIYRHQLHLVAHLYTAEQWAIVAELADVRPPSEVTVSQVLAVIDAVEAGRAHVEGW